MLPNRLVGLALPCSSRVFSAAAAAMSTQFDAIVVGAGIIGSTTAYHLQKAGKKTLMIEQFNLKHSKGSSHGKSRITRYAHADEVYVHLVRDSFRQIRELEKKRGEQLLIETGGIMLGTAAAAEKVAATLARCGEKAEVVTAQELRARYPLFHYGPEYAAVLDEHGGIALADKWMHAFQDEFLQAGGTISDETTVSGFSETDGRVTVCTSRGDFSAPRAVFALGTWINKLLPALPVKGQTELLSVCYWRPKDPADEALVTPDRYPIHIVKEPSTGHNFFSMAAVDHPGAVKFIFNAGQPHDDTDVYPEEIDKALIENVRAHIAKHVPFLDAENGPVVVERCKYTMSPDHHYVIDYLPGSKNIQIAGCMSGSGFKNSPAVGRVVAQRAMDEQPFTDISFFALDRFDKQ